MMPGWPAVAQPAGSIPPPSSAYGYSTNSAAFIPVQVRQSFVPYPPSSYSTQPTPQPASVPAPQMAQPVAHEPEPVEQKKVDWPLSVRLYVQRAFELANQEKNISSTDLQVKLKETIGNAAADGSLFTIDWDSMPLPHVMIREEREEEFRKLVTRIPPPALPGTDSLADLSGSRKRKSTDLAENDLSSSPSWRNSRSSAPLGDRISRPVNDQPLPKSSKFSKDKRSKRFNSEYQTVRSPSPVPSSGPVVGTSQVLEKRYLRLTAPPIPSQVRPEHILRQTLELLKKKWKKESNYSYICDQFKSMRQDLTVQRIKNDFTVSVYEIHARIALEKGDLGEYNQCQTQLRSLYTLGLKGNPIEFKAYRILYFIHTANRTGLNEAMADLTPTEKLQPPIKHALDVRSALALGNYHKFFQLYLDTPNMGAYLMDMFVGRERLAALCNICRAYKPDVPLRFVTEELGFESDADAAQFIVDHNGQHLLEDRKEFIAFLTGKAGGLFEAPKAAAFSKVDIKGQI